MNNSLASTPRESGGYSGGSGFGGGSSGGGFAGGGGDRGSTPFVILTLRIAKGKNLKLDTSLCSA